MAELKIYKSLTKGINDGEFKSEFGRGRHSFISWDSLRPYIEHLCSKDRNEKIDGLKIDEKGIHIKISKNEKV